ncbi:dTDP-glucose 4,6-dehydratase [Mucisphaera sp.]|uniref:dTDP-glucose 4,6-dehydratase n=1 Tax=Mucisphaera sp. TaxID=2913024 RepID=UPI003D118830
MKILITGGCGFIGSNFVRFALESRDDTAMVNLDALTYSGNPESLADIESRFPDRYRFVKGDIRDLELMTSLIAEVDVLVHMAAESHVDRSIIDGRPFVETNVLGTQCLLDALRRADPKNQKRLVHVSTDEVYGDLPLDRPEIKFTETTPYSPSSPYSASKAASDHLVRACQHTHRIQACITNCSNNFGPYQFPEKVIPLFVTNLIQGMKVPLYGDGQNVRDWLHVIDHCEAVLLVAEKGEPGETYNIGGNNERSNLALTHAILEIMGHGEEMIERVADRKGHDRRYAIDASKIARELGWEPSRSAWPEALETTCRWYQENANWWQRIRSGAYREYYAKQYEAGSGSLST